MNTNKINRNDPCPCGSGKKYKKCCITKSPPKQATSVKDIIDVYEHSSKGFDDSLDERSKEEIAYDNIVLQELNKGKSIREALDIAAEKFPEEALQYNDENIDEIYAHYEYHLNHEHIKNRIQQLSN